MTAETPQWRSLPADPTKIVLPLLRSPRCAGQGAVLVKAERNGYVAKTSRLAKLIVAIGDLWLTQLAPFRRIAMMTEFNLQRALPIP